MRVMLNYEDEVITVWVCGDIDFTFCNGEHCIYFIDSDGSGEEWEIPVKDVIKIER